MLLAIDFAYKLKMPESWLRYVGRPAFADYVSIILIILAREKQMRIMLVFWQGNVFIGGH